jgi:Plasmid pRiA4b ORF-3-like protein
LINIAECRLLADVVDEQPDRPRSLLGQHHAVRSLTQFSVPKRRVQVPASLTLRELHGVSQGVMGWEDIHLFQFMLRARRFGSLELAARSPDVPLSELCLRVGARICYDYDLNGPWEHEVRLKSRHEADPGSSYPICLDGDGSCPPEDCGGAAGFLARPQAMTAPKSSDDFAVLADFVDQLTLKRSTGTYIDAEEVDQVRKALERLEVRQGWQGKLYSRKDVNGRLRNAEYLNLVHQQW